MMINSEVKALYHTLGRIEGKVPPGLINQEIEEMNRIVKEYATTKFYERLLIELRKHLGETSSYVVNEAIERLARQEMPWLFAENEIEDGTPKEH